ncbi:MAG: hypothetical protein AB4372_14085 [Xenococcus sp. (in: cyanobacteria)]
MTSSISCPCCSENLLHHLSGSRDYWFCPNCRQEMPHLNAVKINNSSSQNQINNLSLGREIKQKRVLVS